ncbi:MAG: hypothetical protein EPO26_02420 [Chloroflexota bacterium]|nr:MAG: hypothetical protein EPO26_02420 [Chloroflexota bacterium]
MLILDLTIEHLAVERRKGLDRDAAVARMVHLTEARKSASNRVPDELDRLSPIGRFLARAASRGRA